MGSYANVVWCNADPLPFHSPWLKDMPGKISIETLAQKTLDASKIVAASALA
jgi:hypothetical protein